MIRSNKVLNVSIGIISFGSALEYVLRNAIDFKKGFFCFANAHMAVESLGNKELADGLEKDGATIFADGFPIAKSIKLIYKIKQERIAGMDFLPRILSVGNNYGFKVFIVGTTKEILNKVKEKVSKDFPNITIVGTIIPPFDKNWDSENYIKKINETNPNIVFVSLGCPKQEIWMSKYYNNISAPLLGIGGALIVYAGVLKRAPVFIQKIGFEWLYRLFQEPGRLWKRYLFTNSMFLFHIFKQWINVRTEKN